MSKQRYNNGLKYVSNNWKSMSDETLALNLNYSVRTIKMMRNELGVTRYEFKLELINVKVLICEMYVSKIPLMEIAGIVGRSVKHIVPIINNCLHPTLSGDVEVKVFQSKV